MNALQHLDSSGSQPTSTQCWKKCLIPSIQAGKPTTHKQDVQQHCLMMNAHDSQHFPCPCILHHVTARFLLLLYPHCTIDLDLVSLCISKLCCVASTIGIMSCIKNRLLFYTLFFPGGTFFLSIYFQCLLLLSQFHEKNPHSSQIALRLCSCFSLGMSASEWISTDICYEVSGTGQDASRAVHSL